MRKLIMWNIITLDGYFEGDKNWDLALHEAIWGPELQEFSLQQLQSAGLLVFGRVTYEGMAAHWKTAKGEIAQLMNDIPKLVFSRTSKSVDWNNTSLAQRSAAEEISRLKSVGSGDIYIFGSADLSETFIRENLFDEYRIGIAPLILGSGRPLFPNKKFPQIKLNLISSQQLSNGGAILTYKPAGKQG